jgi:hypothetical protein
MSNNDSIGLTHGFKLIRTAFLPEINSTLRWYVHATTGAQLISAINEDENKSFGITFATPPEDSTGIAHIMEHSVLCGSRKYPLKEPFIELAKGSLKTFLNAMTYPDKTSYPIASTNTQDFYNLIDVYLDSVFYPNITPFTLQQEGWHYELNDKDEQMIFKGVVFNEMKGAYSSPDAVMYKRVQQALFPDTLYAHDSGGDPAVIPNLTYAQFKQFHERYYQPANAMIWFWGNDDPDQRLAYMDGWLREMGMGVNRMGEISETKPPNLLAHAPVYQQRFAAPKWAEHTYDSGKDAADSKKAMVMTRWAIGNLTETEDMMWGALSYMLTGTPASPLRKALLDSGLGESVLGGMGGAGREGTFGAGLKGIYAADAKKVEKLVIDTLHTIANEGFEPEMLEAALNTFEFSLREQNTGGFPRGLSAMFGSLSAWLYGEDPFEPLAYEKPLATLKSTIASGEPIFQNLIREKLLNNAHRVTLLVKPDPNLRAREDAAEQARLNTTRAALSKTELQQIVENTHTLKAMQSATDAPEALAKIPSLKLGDIDKLVKPVPTAITSSAGSRVLYHDLFTNGIVYLDLAFDTQAVPLDDVPYLGLIGRLLLEMGTQKENYVRLTQRIKRKTGGIWTSFLSSGIKVAKGVKEANALEARLIVRAKATVAQTEEMLAILRDVLTEVKFDDKERFKQILLQEKASEESGLVPGGSGVVSTRLNAQFNTSSWLDEQIGGVAYLFFIRDLIEQVEQNWSAIVQKLETVRKAIVCQTNLVCNVTLDAANWALVRPQLEQFVAGLAEQSDAKALWQNTLPYIAEGLTIPAQVNYVGKGISLVEHGIETKGWMSVVNQYIRTTWLWDRVRVQGGAYGGQLMFDSLGGTLAFVSYRDPNLLKTLEVYDQTATFLRAHIPNEHELTRCIIGTVSNLDAYQLPDAKGYSAMVRHLVNTEATRQQWRDEVLNTKAEHFRTYADVLDLLRERGQVVVMGGVQGIENAIAAKGNGWLSVTKVM